MIYMDKKENPTAKSKQFEIECPNCKQKHYINITLEIIEPIDQSDNFIAGLTTSAQNIAKATIKATIKKGSSGI